MFIENDIASDGFKFDECYSFEHGGTTNIAFGLSNKDINIGRLAIVRLNINESFGAMWLSDYIDNELTDNKSEVDVSEEDFISYLQLQKSGVINMLDYVHGCEYTGLDKETYLSIIKNYSKLKDQYSEAYENIFKKDVNI